MSKIEESNLYNKEVIALEKERLTGTINDLVIDDNHKLLVALDSNKFCGYLYFTNILDEIEIISICLKKEYEKKGLGKALFEHMINVYKPSNVYLEVSSNNLNAYNFYLRLGFVVYNKRFNYYSDKSDAYLMKWSR